MIFPEIEEKKYPQPDTFDFISAKTYWENKIKKVGAVTPYLHCYTAGKVAERLLKSDLTPESVITWMRDKIPLRYVAFIVALHDIGKISPGFQAMLRNLLKAVSETEPSDAKYGIFLHDIISYIHTIKFIGDGLSKAILYHHGSYRGGDKTYDKYSILPKDEWHYERDRIIYKLLDDFSLKTEDLKELRKIKITDEDLIYIKYLTGLICVSDWIASDEDFFPPSGYDKLFVPQFIEKAFNKYKFFITDYSGIPDMSFKDVFKDPKNLDKIFEPNIIQKAMMENIKGPGFYILDDSTGGGKTEAALYPALDLCTCPCVTGIVLVITEENAKQFTCPCVTGIVL